MTLEAVSSFSDKTDIPMGDRDFARIIDLAYRSAGLSISPGKKSLVYSRLSRRIKSLGIGSFPEYLDLVESREESGELDHLISSLTTNVTAFFREKHHFEHLHRIVLPELAQGRQQSRIRLWSSACSSGEEPYSMALCILAAIPDAAQYDIKILATDIDPGILTTATRGHYPRSALASIPRDINSERYFLPVDGDTVEPGPELRRMVTFKQLNLVRDWPFRGTFDAIFCRNVTIYFAKDTQQSIWLRLAKVLAPGGHLYIGHSERVSGLAEAMLTNTGITQYQRVGADSTALPRDA